MRALVLLAKISAVLAGILLTFITVMTCASIVGRGNIIVDFFTAGCSPKINAVLDRFGALLLAFCFGALAWRTGLGGLSSYISNSGTMILGFPEWIVYACMAPSFALTCVIALGQVALGFDDSLRDTA